MQKTTPITEKSIRMKDKKITVRFTSTGEVDFYTAIQQAIKSHSRCSAAVHM